MFLNHSFFLLTLVESVLALSCLCALESPCALPLAPGSYFAEQTRNCKPDAISKHICYWLQGLLSNWELNKSENFGQFHCLGGYARNGGFCWGGGTIPVGSL